MNTIGVICKSSKSANKISYELGIGIAAMQLMKNKKYDDEEVRYNDWLCNVIDVKRKAELEGINIDGECTIMKNIPVGNVTFDSFAHSLQFIVSEITSIPLQYFIDCEKKNKYIINVKTFEFREQQPGDVLISPYTLYDKMSAQYSFNDFGSPIESEWMTLNSYVVYFGQCVCRNFLGKDIWTRVEERMNEVYPQEEGNVRIYIDIKSESEFEYIRSVGGYIVRITNDKCTPARVYDSRLDVLESDMEVHIGDVNNMTFNGLWKKIYDLAKKVLKIE